MALKPIETPQPEATQPEFAVQPEAAQPEPQAAVSARKLAANRRNARKSTGPRTARGKARSRCNAVKHGVFSGGLIANAVGPAESREIYGVYAALWRIYQPKPGEEVLIVDRMATLWWRLARISAYSQAEFRRRLEAGAARLDATVGCEKAGLAEGRLERSLRGLRKDLVFLQKMRLGRAPRWGAEDERELVEAAASRAFPHAGTQQEPPADTQPETDALQTSEAETDAPEAAPIPSFPRSGPGNLGEGARRADRGPGADDPDGKPPADSAA